MLLLVLEWFSLEYLVPIQHHLNVTIHPKLLLKNVPHNPSHPPSAQPLGHRGNCVTLSRQRKPKSSHSSSCVPQELVLLANTDL